MQRLRQPLHDVAGLMDPAALDRRVVPKTAPDRPRQRLRAVDDEQTRHRRIKPTLNQVVDERLRDRSVLGCAFDQCQRMLDALHPISPLSVFKQLLGATGFSTVLMIMALYASKPTAYWHQWPRPA
jgi:hypothetical protein